MIVRYTKLRSQFRLFDYFYRPMVNIRLINGSRSRLQKALIDTGADFTLINSHIAKDLDINYKDGVLHKTTGIENNPIETYFHELEIEVPGLENSQFKTTVGFINSSSVGVLLGQKGFFDNFKVTFDKKDNFFEIVK